MTKFERLLRNVDIQTQVYITLKQQYEILSLEKVKNTASVFTVDKGVPATSKDSPNRKLILALGISFGFMSGIILILFRHFFLIKR